MGFTRAQLIANTREMMDAASSSRWQDSFVTTVLGIVSADEWGGILGANPYYRFANRAVTTDSNGQIAYTALDSGSGDTQQVHYRILAVTDGNTVYRQRNFIEIPLATTTNFDTPYQKLWYDAGNNLQILPVTSGLSLNVYVNYTPVRIDQLSADSVTVDFPSGHEVILWLQAAAMLLSKGGAENDAAQTMRAIADQERQQMYQDIGRRSARPNWVQFEDSASEWGG